ncbi:MAG: FimV family protein [Brachymonas sp.]|jgi:pilus assembly protein FimV|nr:FimV family protein [Brachymonas sp.]MBP6967139.1 FimV family protein [Brachymonas sp.]MBP7246537.1 FimV family protein [Brachymonas sp.]MBP7740384.1 FimV family protein [Brachymonas sp.]MBP8597211.1 FimV family protein [Brachymonas sp.]
MRFRTSVLSLAVALAVAGVGSNAYALGFGKIHVKSALGQPLDAEVELTEAQAANLKAGMASAQVYQDKGLDYNPTVKSVRSSLRRGANGRMVLHLSSDRPINDPFLDVVLQANDGSSNVIRDFSILLDPPVKAKAPVTIVAPVTSGKANASQANRIVLPQQDGAMQDTAGETAEKRTTTRAKKRTGQVRSGSVRVHSGETAGRIAMAYRPAHVSLDQMLLALLKANSHAFINGNVNHLKAGVVLKMPTAQQARETSAAEARTIIVAQSEDFRAYRHQLAKSSMVQAAPSSQQSSGKVQTQVLDSKTSPAVAPDQLTISNSGTAGKKQAKEERIAKALEKKDKTNRAEELNKNLADLKNISAEVAAASSQKGTGKATKTDGSPLVITAPIAAQPKETTPAPAVVVPKPVELAPAVSAPKEAEAQTIAASAPVELASEAQVAASQAASQAELPASAAEELASEASAPAQPASVAKKEPVKPAPEPVAESSFIDDLLANPMMLGGGALVVALGALLVWRKKRQKADAGDDDFLDSSFSHGDSFFHASGGKSVDTSETGTGGSELNQSSMLYSPSQLDAEADVDPVSEADVYLAYGRDIQAEEILNDAMVKYPERVSIYIKLLEIYEKRRDIKSYAQTAAHVKRLTQASGSDWEAIRAKGSDLDPANPLYAPASNAGNAKPVEAPSVQQQVQAPRASTSAGSASGALAMEDSYAQLSPPTLSPMTVPVTVQTETKAEVMPIDLSLDLSELNVPDASNGSQSMPSVASSSSFDMSGLSLDLDGGAAPAEQSAADGNALVTKLSLAREFLSFGDKDGARAMAQEVAKDATGDLQAQAQALIQSIG